jgi:uncharacterized membrane protein YedE/YeeE
MVAQRISSTVAGLVFGFGLALSGMTRPSKVLGFLDVTGDWDPSLLLVLGGAVGVTVVAFRFILRCAKPILEPAFKLPAATRIDTPLLAGSLIFGLGWGISGYCPGPAIASFAAPNWETWVFVPAVLLGAALHKALIPLEPDAVPQSDLNTEGGSQV